LKFTFGVKGYIHGFKDAMISEAVLFYLKWFSEFVDTAHIKNKKHAFILILNPGFLLSGRQ